MYNVTPVSLMAHGSASLSETSHGIYHSPLSTTPDHARARAKFDNKLPAAPQTATLCTSFLNDVFNRSVQVTKLSLAFLSKVLGSHRASFGQTYCS